MNQLAKSGGFLGDDDNSELAIADVSTIEALTRGEVDMQVATAKRYPRNLKRFKNEVLELATADADSAAECFYALPRDGKTIEGPSVRLAEIVASAWGNMRTEMRIIGVGQDFITAQATAWDVERNNLNRCELQRRITTSKGRRYSDDMIVVTGNAASKIAYRNAIFTTVPKAHWSPIYEQCRLVAVGDQRSLADNRAQWVGYFGKLGIVEARVLAMLNRSSLDEVTIEDLMTLRGTATAIKENQITIDEVFPDASARASNGPPKSLNDLVGPPNSDPNEKVEKRAPAAAGFMARGRQ